MATRPSLRTDSPRAVPTDDLACESGEGGWVECMLLHFFTRLTHVHGMICDAQCVCHIPFYLISISLRAERSPLDTTLGVETCTLRASRVPAQGGYAFLITQSLLV